MCKGVTRCANEWPGENGLKKKVITMEAIQPSTAAAALNVHDLRRQECKGGEEGESEYYLGLLSTSSSTS